MTGVVINMQNTTIFEPFISTYSCICYVTNNNEHICKLVIELAQLILRIHLNCKVLAIKKVQSDVFFQLRFKEPWNFKAIAVK